MFSKLLKHEWKQSAGFLGLLSLGALGIGLLGGLALRGILYMEALIDRYEIAALGVTGLSGALVFIILALVAYGFGVQFLNLYRFYKNKFTDEGYLTFTLPVDTKQIFLSSFLVLLAWLVISVLVLLAAVALIALVGAGEYLVEFRKEIIYTIKSIFYMTDFLENEPGYTAYMVLSTVSACITPIYSLILLMSSITIGSVLAKKHKVLAAIGSYYCINFGVNTVESILTVVPTILAATSFAENFYVFMNIPMAVALVLQVGLSVGGFFLSSHLMKRKLNLP